MFNIGILAKTTKKRAKRSLLLCCSTAPPSTTTTPELIKLEGTYTSATFRRRRRRFEIVTQASNVAQGKKASPSSSIGLPLTTNRRNSNQKPPAVGQ
jgi:hypothetical protein